MDFLEFDTWAYYLALMVATVGFGYLAASEYGAVLRPWYERGTWLLLAGRALLVFGWLFYFAKMGLDGLVPGVVLALAAGGFAKFEA